MSLSTYVISYQHMSLVINICH